MCGGAVTPMRATIIYICILFGLVVSESVCNGSGGVSSAGCADASTEELYGETVLLQELHWLQRNVAGRNMAPESQDLVGGFPEDSDYSGPDVAAEDRDPAMRFDDMDEQSMILDVADVGFDDEIPDNLIDLANIEVDGAEGDHVGNIGSCGTEAQLRNEIRRFFDKSTRRRGGPSVAPVFVRAAFHDAIDENNLLVKVNDSWEHVPGNYGGLDGCMYSPLSNGTSGIPVALHNWGLDRAIGFARQLSSNAFRQGFCTVKADCTVDMLALGAIVAVEMAGGPSIPMKWGRTKGNCKEIIVLAKAGQEHLIPALRDAPSLTDIENPSHFREAFQVMGFSAWEQTALMGAHTFGKVGPVGCDFGVLGNVHQGTFCNQRDLLNPVVTDDMLVEKGCEVKFNQISRCWSAKSEGTLYPAFKSNKNASAQELEAVSPKLAAVQSHRRRSAAAAARREGERDLKMMHAGGFWDRTPDKFDNDYFRLFYQEAYENKDICCGNHRGQPFCSRGGRLYNQSARAQVDGDHCSVNWCRDDALDHWGNKMNGRSVHMKSTKAWAEVDPVFVDDALYLDTGHTRRMLRLPGDWALLGHPETREAVTQFAENESLFFSTFVQAFGKVLSKGHDTLAPCTETPTASPTVTPLPTASPTATPSSSSSALQNGGKGCWRQCHRRGGLCGYCGAGACCAEGFSKDPDVCKSGVFLRSSRGHQCVSISLDPTPPPTHPTSLANGGKGCWRQCHRRGGLCEYCGAGACCAKGFSKDPDICKTGVFLGNSRGHRCVSVSLDPTPPPTRPTSLANGGKGCWRQCHRRGGLCEYCGAGACCSKGFSKDPDICKTGAFLGNSRGHRCVSVSLDPTPPPTRPTSLANGGKGCWRQCHRRGGLCEYCGAGACCSKGFSKDPDVCKTGVFLRNSRGHQCVAISLDPTPPPTRPTSLANGGKGCWRQCHRRGGLCEYCGAGACCAKGFSKDPDVCKSGVFLRNSRGHQCVSVSPPTEA